MFAAALTKNCQPIWHPAFFCCPLTMTFPVLFPSSFILARISVSLYMVLPLLNLNPPFEGIRAILWLTSSHKRLLSISLPSVRHQQHQHPQMSARGAVPRMQLKKLGSVLPNTAELTSSYHTASQEMSHAVSEGNCQDS